MNDNDDPTPLATPPLGAIFGLGLSPGFGDPTPQELVDAELRHHALAAALLTSCRRRGRPIAHWRVDLREDVLSILADDPTLTASEFASVLTELPICRELRIGSYGTVMNWLSQIRRA